MTEGLRERKKRATLNAIERTAVRLALEKGHLHVTVPEICAGAEVSRSTFFNYVPNREAAIFGRPMVMIGFDEAWALLEEHGPTSLLRALFRISLLSVGQSTVNVEVAAGRQRLGMEQPDTNPMLLAPFVALSTELTGLLYLWLEADPRRRRLPQVATLQEAILTVSVIGNALQGSLADLQGTDDVELGEQAIVDVVEQVAQVVTFINEPLPGAEQSAPE